MLALKKVVRTNDISQNNVIAIGKLEGSQLCLRLAKARGCLDRASMTHISTIAMATARKTSHERCIKERDTLRLVVSTLPCQ